MHRLQVAGVWLQDAHAHLRLSVLLGGDRPRCLQQPLQTVPLQTGCIFPSQHCSSCQQYTPPTLHSCCKPCALALHLQRASAQRA